MKVVQKNLLFSFCYFTIQAQPKLVELSISLPISTLTQNEGSRYIYVRQVLWNVYEVPTRYVRMEIVIKEKIKKNGKEWNHFSIFIYR
jgi:hypothetical protein